MLVTPLRHRKGIAGDFLEEYRDVGVPRRGDAGADAWYVRQVLMFLWRAAPGGGPALRAPPFIPRPPRIYTPPPPYYFRPPRATHPAMSLFPLSRARPRGDLSPRPCR